MRSQLMSSDYHSIVTATAREMADTYDEQILAFFGSEEQVRAYAHLFVIEQLPLVFTVVPGVEGRDNQFIYHVETEIRIRPKTMAELEAEKNV
ncbi:hypothetical protein SEA_CATERPILLAR_75 [Arthrobacter phage Caterpillar]|nr:hypothetical protein SEA_CATERPILLAR_75 [Arthrobacter phage Caterpillar]